MEASRFLPEGEPKAPEIVCLKEYSEGQEVIYHFRDAGQESGLTMARETVDDTASDYTYQLIFFGWKFAEVDVHSDGETAFIDWRGEADGLDEEQRPEACRLIPGSMDFLVAALKTDFPGALCVVDVNGEQL